VVLRVLGLLAALAACWLPTVLLGGEAHAPPLWFLAPIVWSAARHGTTTAVAVALLCGVAAGPLTPHDVATGTPQDTVGWLVRSVFFVVVALLASAANVRLRLEVARAAEGEERLRRQALHDPLTGLPNRALLDEHLAVALAAARRGRRQLGLAFIDLDQFKLVNDSLGHAAGDELLREVARRLDGARRAGDLLARPGGDEFLVVLCDVDGEAGALAAVERLLDALRVPLHLGEVELQIDASAGVSLFPRDAADPDALARHADAAMYQAKARACGVALYAPSADDPLARLSLAARLRRAAERDELELHFQPIVRLADRGVLGVEGLLRWRDPERGLVAPAAFIPVAEETGVIDALGEWALRTTCAQAVAWEAEGLLPNIGLNVSPRQLRSPAFAERFAGEVARHGLDPRRLVIELTESAWTVEPDRTLPVLDALRAAGFPLALDDFGVGASSLARLLELPVAVMKIDRAFLCRVPGDARARAVVSAILALAEATGCDVVAEGVETTAQEAFLLEQGCRLVQGFGLWRPLPAEEVTAVLREHLVDDRRRAPVIIP
jgi:diguanylate cyclase (GGDEF)-like protein